MQTIRDILESIFNADTGYDSTELSALNQSPSYGEVFDFVKIIANSPVEEDVQVFIQKHPKFLMSMFGWADDAVLAIISKPKIGNQYIADFGVLQFGQGGCSYNLIELEPINEKLYTLRRSPSKRHQSAITQVQDWSEWINKNKQKFISDAIAFAKKLPLYPKATHNGSFRVKSPTQVEGLWRAFGGFDDALITYTIIIGRWSKLSDAEKTRLLSNNRNNNNLYTTYTYDQMIRRGIERPFSKW